MKSHIPIYDHIYLKDVATYLYKPIIIYYDMLNYLVPVINKSQVKINSWSKDDHNSHILPPYINLKLNLRMKPNINILVISTTI